VAEGLLAGAILAGGRSTRMGGKLKALVELNGRPLLQHVIDRLQPQVSQIYLSVAQFNPALEVFGLAQVEDPESGSCGPLGGLMTSLQALPEGQDWLLLLPCDAPFLPPDLGSRLHSAVVHEGTLLGVVDDAGQLQPTFSLWNRRLLPSIQQAVLEQGMGGFMQFLDGVRFSSVTWHAGDTGNKRSDLPFFNINTPADLRQAESVINSGSVLR
jgi:molybdopterin-guanine dinucleotide biosynthesis protein A